MWNLKTKHCRLLWGILLLTCVLICLGQILKLFARLLSSPVVDSFSSREMYVYEVPFPAVTVCSETKSIRKLFSFEEATAKQLNKTKLSKTEQKLYDYLFDICDYHGHSRIERHDLDFFDEEMYEMIDNITDTLDNTITYCEWQKLPVNCSEFLTRVFIDEGICYSFNILDKQHLFSNKSYVPENFFNGHVKKNDLTDEKQYRDPGNKDNYPRQSPIFGAERALLLHLRLNVLDYDFECKSYIQGFRIVIHSPTHIPQGRQNFLRLSSSHSSSISVIPNLIQNAHYIHFFSPSARKCYMSNEKHLKYFRHYTETNCRLECISNYTLLRCECVAYYMPRSRDIPICGFSRLDCVQDAKREMEKNELQGKLERLNFCGCMSSCTKLSYRIEETSSSIPNLEESHSTNNTTIMHKIAKLRIYFQENSFLIKRREEVFTVTALLAKIGGLVGLYLGASIITLIEFIYFWSWRLLYNKRLYNRWLGPQLTSL